MRKPNIAILGATGVVGREITKIIDELKIDFNEIKFLSCYYICIYSAFFILFLKS